MIEIGKSIYNIMTGSTGITSIVGNSIYPLVIPEGGVLPCIVYERNFNNNYTKDGISNTDTNLDITILALNYSDSINISSAVFKSLNMFNGTSNGTRIYTIHLVGGGEAYGEGAYVQNLSFEIKSSLV